MKRLFQVPMIDWSRKFEQKREQCTHPALKQFYGVPLPSPSTPLNDVTFLAMDFETTGLNPNSDEIITIGTVPFTLDRIFINQAKHWTVRPRRPLEEESVIIHGITHSDILHAPDISELFPEILEQIAGRITVVHYQRIEREFFDSTLRNRINEGVEFPLLDTLAIEAAIQEKQFGGFLNKLRGKRPNSVRLGASRTRYGLPAYTPHHALTDAIATAELLQAQIAYHYDRTSPIGKMWL